VADCKSWMLLVQDVGLPEGTTPGLMEGSPKVKRAVGLGGLEGNGLNKVPRFFWE